MREEKFFYDKKKTLDVVKNKSMIKTLIEDDGFYVNLDGDIGSFFQVFEDFLLDNEDKWEYCGFENLSEGGYECYNSPNDGDVIIYNSGLVDNFVFLFNSPATEKTDWELSEEPLKVILKGYFVITKNGYIFYPLKIKWNESILKETTEKAI